MLDNEQIRKTKSGKLYNISFKYASQTYAGKYKGERLYQGDKTRGLSRSGHRGVCSGESSFYRLAKRFTPNFGTRLQAFTLSIV